MPEPSPAAFAIEFEIVADKQNPANPATLDTIGSEIRKQLTKAGYTVRPIYSGARGGELFLIISTYGPDALLVTSILATILGAIKTAQDIFSGMRQEPPTITLTTQVNERTISTIEASDLEQIVEKQGELQKRLAALPAALPPASRTKIRLSAQQPAKGKKR
jgi:hypothetical protein